MHVCVINWRGSRGRSRFFSPPDSASAPSVTAFVGSKEWGCRENFGKPRDPSPAVIAICERGHLSSLAKAGPMRLLPALLWLLSAWRSDALERASLQLRGTLRPRVAISMVSPNKQAGLGTALQRAITAAAALTILSQGAEPSLAEEFTLMPGVAPAYAADGGAGEQVRRRLEPRSSSRPAPLQLAARGNVRPLSCR